MKKILVIDFNIQEGHVNLNRKFLELISKKYDVTFISSKSYLDKIGFSNSIEIQDKKFQFNSKYHFVLKQILLIRLILRTFVKGSDYNRILILGYENISLAIAWHGVSIPTYAIAHNNLTRGKLSLAGFKIISKVVIHVFFEDYIKKEYDSLVKNKIVVIPHPINPNIADLKEEKKEEERNIIFCPSASSDILAVKKLIHYVKSHKMFKFYAKGDYNYESENIVIKKFFKDYESLLLISEYIFIPFKYDNRVSGIFFDAMSLKKTIITLDSSGKFMHEMSKLYPNSVYVLKSISHIEHVNISSHQQTVDNENFIKKHSDNALSNQLNKILGYE